MGVVHFNCWTIFTSFYFTFLQKTHINLILFLNRFGYFLHMFPLFLTFSLESSPPQFPPHSDTHHQSHSQFPYYPTKFYHLPTPKPCLSTPKILPLLKKWGYRDRRNGDGIVDFPLPGIFQRSGNGEQKLKASPTIGEAFGQGFGLGWRSWCIILILGWSPYVWLVGSF